MATNPPKGPGRVGAVKDRSQVFNPHNKRWVKINKENNLFMDQKSDKNHPFKGVRKDK
jgi:hypothetical protein